MNDDIVYYKAIGNDKPLYDADNPIMRSQPVVENSYLTDTFTREAISFIERKKNHPFFPEVAFNAVHSPCKLKRRHG